MSDENPESQIHKDDYDELVSSNEIIIFQLRARVVELETIANDKLMQLSADSIIANEKAKHADRIADLEQQLAEAKKANETKMREGWDMASSGMMKNGEWSSQCKWMQFDEAIATRDKVK
jgi:hypothetical protein